MPSSPSRQVRSSELKRLIAHPFAHRGLHGPAGPENSRAAFAAAVAAGHGIELDVQASAEGAAIVFHDEALDRLTGAAGPICGLAAAEIGRIRLRGSDETIPSLGDALTLIDGLAPLLIEVKARRGAHRPLCESVATALANYSGPVAVMSFNPRVGHWFARHHPGVPRGLVVSEQDKPKLRGRIERALSLRWARPDFLACDIRDLPSRFAIRAGLPVLTWTVRSAADRARAAAHADQIIYEAPAEAHRPPVHARLAEGIAELAAEDWDRCAGSDDPFLSHAFLSALEQSGSADAAAGWQPLPIAIDGDDGRPAAVMPAYVKSHSQGEYVFDHGWAEAYERAGGDYYPKLQIAVPFTPVPGRRLLARDPAMAPALIAAAELVVDRHRLSSAHATFLTPDDVALFRAAGWLIRTDSQFHWLNEGFGDFEDFLATLASRKRKAIRRERALAVEGLEIVHLSGAAIEEAHWDAFWDFYQDTGARKWGRPYLTRAFFSLLGERLADKVLLILALRDGAPIAGALNLIGAEALYGRYWGCIEEVPHLHFELCYYQAIEAAIARGLGRVEAGAQGAHKLARGYRPVATFSAHYLRDRRLREAVAGFLAAERRAVAREIAALDEMTPFRKG
jgi:predicted N-acyltransferase/glycerophosphoryl diester phosphodiesterase